MRKRRFEKKTDGKIEVSAFGFHDALAFVWEMSTLYKSLYD